MANNIKLIVLDLDRTTVQHDNKVTEHTKQVFARVREKGIKVAVATGRSVDEAVEAADAVGADEFIIALTGCQLLDRKTGNNLFLHSFTHDQAVKIGQIIQKYRDTYFQLYTAQGLISTDYAVQFIYDCPLPEGYADYAKSMMTIVPDIGAYLNESGRGGEKYFALCNDLENLSKLREELCAVEGVFVVNSLKEALEIMPENTNKGRAVAALKAHLGLSTQEVMVVGDSENDMDMFREAGLKVAVGNAFACLKEQADFVAPRFDEEGAAFAAEKFLLAD